jgi:hypothetical protein
MAWTGGAGVDRRCDRNEVISRSNSFCVSISRKPEKKERKPEKAQKPEGSRGQEKAQ